MLFVLSFQRTCGGTMRTMTFIRPLVFVFLIFSAGGLDAARAGKVDNAIFASLLSAYVKQGRVDYKGIQENEKKLDQYLEVLASIETGGLTKDGQMAFYINAYNAWTIKLILSRYPDLESIKDIGTLFKSPWKKKIVKVNKTVYTLDEIEHAILRPRFKDPRVHFAVNCASKGCPPLISEPYDAQKLNVQLDRSTAAFINNPGFNRLEGDTLKVSSIFKWFSKDFNEDIKGFFLKYAEADLKAGLSKNTEKIKIRYLKYDWTLNDVPGRK